MSNIQSDVSDLKNTLLLHKNYKHDNIRDVAKS